MTRGARSRVARNIYRDAFGFAVVVERRGQRLEERFPPHTPLDALRVVRDSLIDRLELHDAPRAGTLADDAATVLQTLPAGPHRRDVRTMLDHWLTAAVTVDGQATTFAALPRAAVTPLQVRTQLAVFAARYRPKTVRELRRVFSWLYATLDGPDARNPVRAVPAPRVRYDDARGIDYAVIAHILAAMPDRGRPEKGKTRPAVNLTKIRLAVMAYTGLHQREIARLEPRHVDLARRRVWMPDRRKGAGAPGAWHRLIGPGVAALRAFVAANAFGAFSARSMAKSWRRALESARAAWTADPATARQPWPVPDDARPYDLRHSFGSAVYLATGDIRAAQELLRHRQGSTTERYTRAGVSARADAARTALEKFLK